MRVLVTGGSGFIGKYVVRNLIMKGYEVGILDILELNDVKSHKIDLRNFKSVNKVLKKYDAVVHLAVSISDDNLEDFMINVIGTLNLLIASVDNKVKRFVYASTSSIYEGLNKIPNKESDFVKPRTSYTICKQMGELYCNSFNKYYGLNTVSLRFFNVYGKGGHSVINLFIDRVKNDLPIEISNKKTTRDLIYVEDIADAVVRALETDVNGVINVGTGNSVGLTDVALMIYEHLEVKKNIKFKNNEKSIFCADTRKMREKLKFLPKVDIKSGIKLMLN